MKPGWLYRIAAVSFVLFAAGHTWGFLNFKPSTPEATAVFASMNNVHFEEHGSRFSSGEFYRGFGLYVSVYLFFSAFLAWHLGGLAQNLPQAIGALGWLFFAVQLASLLLSWIYFSAPPAIFSAVVAICLGWAATLASLRTRKLLGDSVT